MFQQIIFRICSKFSVIRAFIWFNRVLDINFGVFTIRERVTRERTTREKIKGLSKLKRESPGHLPTYFKNIFTSSTLYQIMSKTVI